MLWMNKETFLIANMSTSPKVLYFLFGQVQYLFDIFVISIVIYWLQKITKVYIYTFELETKYLVSHSAYDKSGLLIVISYA